MIQPELLELNVNTKFMQLGLSREKNSNTRSETLIVCLDRLRRAARFPGLSVSSLTFYKLTGDRASPENLEFIDELYIELKTICSRSERYSPLTTSMRSTWETGGSSLSEDFPKEDFTFLQVEFFWILSLSLASLFS